MYIPVWSASIRTFVFYLSLGPVWQNVLHHRDQVECYHLTPAAALTHSSRTTPRPCKLTHTRYHSIPYFTSVYLLHTVPARPFFAQTLDLSADYLVASACYFPASSVVESSREDREAAPSHLYSSHWQYCTKMADQGGGALRGLRLITVERGPQGFGFHMYTNKVLKVNA